VKPDPIKEITYSDEGLQEGASYTYQVKALREVQGTLLESEGSGEKEVVFTRVGPPPVIEELLAVAGPRGIELRWQRLENVIISGYYIYKRTANEKTPNRASQEMVRDTTFQDGQVVPGRLYFYSVSVVGAPPALKEGPRSKEIQITFNP
jgi:hypothetical protein